MAKYKSFGAKFQYNNSGWLDLAQVASIGPFDMQRETIDTTTHDSTSGYRELVGHLRRVQPFAVTVVYDPVDTGHVFMRNAYTSGSDTGTAFRLVFADTGATDWEQNCIVTGFQVSDQTIDGRLEAVITLTPSGAPNFTPA